MYFQNLLNNGDGRGREEAVSQWQVPVVTGKEVEAALRRMKKRKAWRGVQWLVKLLNNLMTGNSILSELRKSHLMLFKDKGDRMKCENYRRIKFVSQR